MDLFGGAASPAGVCPSAWFSMRPMWGDGGVAERVGRGDRVISENSLKICCGHTPTIPVSATERETQSVWDHFIWGGSYPLKLTYSYQFEDFFAKKVFF